MKVKKAIIPAAGLGTRMLPVSKVVPKEMVAVVDKPSIQYIVEEAVASGIEEILIITNRGKEVIEDHFDITPELEEKLAATGKTEQLREMRRISDMANIYFLRQKETKGLGHAVYCARAFVGDEPFAVLYGDDVVIGQPPAISQLIAAYEKYGQSVAGVQAVSPEDITRYSSLAVEQMEERIYRVTDMIEKPAPDQVLSLYSILGRCVLTPDIFDILAQTPEGAGGEIQLTDAMKTLCLRDGMLAVDYIGKRYDMGNKLGVLKASVEMGLCHPEIGEAFTAYLKDLVQEL